MPAKPTGRQLNYLRALANRTGQTFTYPHTRRQASREIQRLKQAGAGTRSFFSDLRAKYLTFRSIARSISAVVGACRARSD